MSVLASASSSDWENLLDLFPAKALREHWTDVKGKKEHICAQLASREKPSALVEFVHKYFSRCKLHVHVYSHNGEVKKVPSAGIGGERVKETGDKSSGSALYMYWAEFEGVLTEPYEKKKLKFLWPVRLDFDNASVRVTAVVMEKNLASYFEGRELIGPKKLTDEDAVLTALVGGLKIPLPPTDLHKGVKKLWQDDLVDCVRVRYKNPYSTDTTTMDEAHGIREKNPALYEALLKTPLINAQFRVKSKLFSDISIFSTDPTNGYIAFPRYTNDEGDTDNVVREILRLN
jgi:hypothetical protein